MYILTAWSIKFTHHNFNKMKQIHPILRSRFWIYIWLFQMVLFLLKYMISARILILIQCKFSIGRWRHLSWFTYLSSFGLLKCLAMLRTLITRNKVLTANFLKHEYWYHKHRKAFFQNSIDATMTWYKHLMWDSNLFLNKVCRNLNCIVS